MIDSASRAGKNYYPQVFLEECKYVVKEKEISSDSDRVYSDEENSNEGNSNEQNSYEENSKYRICLVFIFKAF